MIFDDGIVARLGEHHFWVNTTSGGAERVALAFEEWLQCEFVHHRVLVTPVTSNWGNVTVAGPRSWALLQAVGFDQALAPAARARFIELSGANANCPEQAMIRLAYASTANTAIIAAQDALGLGRRDRMNVPGVSHGNWSWRLQPHALTSQTAKSLRTLAVDCGRLKPKHAAAKPS